MPDGIMPYKNGPFGGRFYGIDSFMKMVLT